MARKKLISKDAKEVKKVKNLGSKAPPKAKAAVRGSLLSNSSTGPTRRQETKQSTQEPTMASSKKRSQAILPLPNAKPAKKLKSDSAINSTPSQELDIYVFGAGEYGELGLGNTVRNGKKPTSVKRPRLNDLLDADTVGVVQIAVGGMHCAALTHDNKIFTWGVNDNGALGRDTTWEAPTRDIDADSEDSEEEDEDGASLNPKESTPTAIPTELFGQQAKSFVQIVASDNATFALTADGFVYGWGTFSGNDGVFGFFKEDAAKDKKVQRTPALIPELKNIKSLAAGGNHIQALDQQGNVFSWGGGEQSQLGRRLLARRQLNSLVPCQFGLPKKKITYVSCGPFHSFAIDDEGNVYAWGLNNFGQTGVARGAGESDAFIQKPTIVQNLEPYRIKKIQGGNHHSIACTEDGKVLVWGRCDDGQLGVSIDDLPQEDLIFDNQNKPRIFSKPAIIPDIHAASVAAGIDNSFAITNEGKAYAWGFSANYRTGLGTDDPVKVATLVDNSALKDKKITFAACGGQFGVLAGPASRR